MDSTQEPGKPQKAHDQALRFVIGMGLTIFAVAAICTLLWWFISDHRFDILGRYIIIAGIICIIFGVATLIDQKRPVRLKAVLHQVNGRRIDMHKGHQRMGEPGGKFRWMMFLWGVGLLCLLVGNLIILGL